MREQVKTVELIESAEYGLEDFLNDVVRHEENAIQMTTENNGEKIYRYIKENM